MLYISQQKFCKKCNSIILIEFVLKLQFCQRAIPVYHSQIQRYCPSNKHLLKMKSTTYIAEITVQKNEKYLYEGRNTLAYLPAHLMSTKKFSAFEFTEKCFTVFGQSNCMIYISRGISRSYFSGNFLLSLLLWYGFKILVKSRGGGTFLCLASSVNVWQK